MIYKGEVQIVLMKGRYLDEVTHIKNGIQYKSTTHAMGLTGVY